MRRPSLGQLRDAWAARPPAPADSERLIEMLKGRFHAYEVPAGIVPASEYERDDDVTESDVWKLFLITDRETVEALIAPEAFERGSRPPSASGAWPPSLEPDWPEILGNFHDQMLPVAEAGFRLFTALASRGLALGVVLESQDQQVVDGFKIYGPSDKLTDILIAHTGWAKYARSTANPDGVAVGDIGDEDFARYLRVAHAEGLIEVSR